MSLDSESPRAAALAVTLALTLCGASAVQAGVITDPAGDFLASYTGPRGADLDIRSAAVTFDGDNFTFAATADGAIGTTAQGGFVFGIDRGSAPIDNSGLATTVAGVAFDALLFMPGGGSLVVLDTHAGAQLFDHRSFNRVGDSFSVTIPKAALLSAGQSPSDFRFSLWSHRGSADTDIADFAPGGGTFTLATTAAGVPEPASWALMLSGFFLAGAVVRRRRVAATAV